MRNLKRVLSLALAAMMLIGMMVITSSAAEATKTSFPDADEITNTEAVDVITAIGVMQGHDDGTFAPGDILTREQAATIICNMLLGPENAEKLTATQDVFDDVPASWWSAKYVQYCVNLGIISGNGDGTFDPEGQLTGTAFGKMMLVALGYNAQYQNYLGNPNWESLVVSDMLDAGIAVSGINATEPLSRDNAAQMAFQTLTATMVKYANQGSQIIIGDTQVINTPSAAEKIAVSNEGAKNYAGSDNDGDGYQQFCEKYFADLKLVSDSTQTDEFGRPSDLWQYKNEDITYRTAKAVKTYTSAVKKADLGLKDNIADSVDVYENGVKISDSGFTLDKLANLTGAGATVSVYTDDNNKISTVVVINTYIGDVTKVATEKGETTVTVRSLSDQLPLGNKTFKSSAFDKGDIVLYTVGSTDGTSANQAIQTMTLAESVTGYVDRVNTSGNNQSLVIDGATYKWSKKADTSIRNAVADADTEVVVYLDGDGNAIYSDTVSTSSNVKAIYVVKSYSGVNSYGAAGVKMIQGVLSDGTVIATETTNTLDQTESQTASLKAYTYTVSNSVYTLTNSTAIGSLPANGGVVELTTDVNIKTSDRKLAGGVDKYFAPDVKFIYMSGTLSDLSVSVKDGVQAVDIDVSEDHAYAVIDKDSNDNLVVTAVYIYGDAAAVSDDIIYVAKVSRTGTSIGPDGTRLYGYEVYINGEKGTAYFDSQSDPVLGFHAYSVNEKTGAYTLKSAPSNAKTGLVTSDVTLLNGTYYVNLVGENDWSSYDATDAIVVDVQPSGNDKIESLADLRAACNTDGKTVNVAVTVDTEAKIITAIYVTDSSSGQAVGGSEDTTASAGETTNVIGAVTGSVSAAAGTAEKTTTVEISGGINEGTVTADQAYTKFNISGNITAPENGGNAVTVSNTNATVNITVEATNTVGASAVKVTNGTANIDVNKNGTIAANAIEVAGGTVEIKLDEEANVTAGAIKVSGGTVNITGDSVDPTIVTFDTPAANTKVTINGNLVAPAAPESQSMARDVAPATGLTIPTNVEVIVNGDIGKGVTVEVTGKLKINGTVKAGADITVKGSDLSIITIGENAEFEDAIKVDATLSTTIVKTATVGVPYYAATGAKDSDGWNIQDCTVAIKWKTTEGTEVVQTITDGQQTYTVTGEKAGADGNVTMFDLKNPFYQDSDESIDGEWTEKPSGDFTAANAGDTLTIKVATTEDNEEIVNFTMPNPVKTQGT